MKKIEQDHVAKVGQSRFDAALAKASLSVRMNDKFRAAHKTREEIAWHSTLAATGFEVGPFVPSCLKTAIREGGVGREGQAFLDMCEAAVEAAKAAVADADRHLTS